jgi:pyridoxal phosphate enzyme (YggS family)
VIDSAALRTRLSRVRERIARAAGRIGRDPASIRLVAVSKTFPADCIRALADTGQIDFGENKVQEALQKMEQTSDLPLRWHLIGHLQSNKAKKAARFDVVHSIDDAALLHKVDDAATIEGRALDVLVQVDLANEPTKHGARPDEVPRILAAASACRAVRVRGLMLLPPVVDDPDEVRPYFATLRNLRERLVANGASPGMLGELSMGMSHDFEVAIEEGATLVRVGSAIFGPRG